MTSIKTWICLGMAVFSITGCTSVAASSSSISLQEWVDSAAFTPLILWPVPKDMALVFPPLHHSRPDHMLLFYSEGFIATGVQPPSCLLYESGVSLLIGTQLLTDWDVSTPGLTISAESMMLEGQEVLLEVREHVQKPEQGVISFVLNGVYVALEWRSMPRREALDVLMLLTAVHEGDKDLIAAFDQDLITRFGTPSP